MSVRQRLFTWLTLVGVALVLALSWITTVLAQADSDGDGFAGDELSLPIVLGVGVLVYLGWMVVRRRSRKSPD